MYIPKHKLKVGGKIAGKLIDPKTKRNFLGKFVQDHKGNFYKGETITSKSEPLEFIADDKEAEKALGLVTSYRKPTPEDYGKGIFERYFVKDAPTGRVIEVDKQTYLQQTKANKIYRKTLKIGWYVNGPVDDEIKNGYLYPGARAKNEDVINQAEKILSGIGKQVLKDPTQYVV